MTWSVVGRRGRVPDGPGRPEPHWSTIESVQTCAAWLLWANRAASSIGDVGGVKLQTLLEERCPELSVYSLSRAEKGNHPAVLRTVEDYESLLDLRYGQLQAPLAQVARVVQSETGGSKVLTPPAYTDAWAQDVIDELFDRHAAGQSFSGSDWLKLARVVCGPAPYKLPKALIRKWLDDLIGELMRSINFAYYTRSEAASTFAAHPNTALFVLQAVERNTRAPDASGAFDAWGIVADIRRVDVFQRIIDRLDAVGERTFGLYAGPLTQALHLGLLEPAQHQTIAAAIGRRIPRWSNPSFNMLATVASELPPRLGAPLLREIDQRSVLPRTVGIKDNSSAAWQLATYEHVAAEASRPGTTDYVLRELLRVIIQNDHFSHTFHASTLLNVSPYSAPLASAAIEVTMSQDADRHARLTANQLLKRLVTEEHSQDLRELLSERHRPGLIQAALTGLAHMRQLEPRDVEALIGDPQFDEIVVYAAGITGHSDILDRYPDRASAAWWRTTGMGVWD